MKIHLIKYQFIILLNIFFFIIFINLKVKKSKNNKIINEPILPRNNKEYVVKKYQHSHYNLNHSRYNFQEKYNKRKTFNINYSFYPYLQISQKLSYEENAMFIFNSTGMLNLTKLDYYYFKIKNEFNILELNHIHIAMAFDRNYTDLSLISIASVLNTSSSDTYIHFHILGLNFRFEEIKNIIDLRKINKKVEFIFYNAKQVEYDFEIGKNQLRGLGNVARILCSQIINNTNKILILDSGDILCQKDLSEIYFYDIGNNYFGWILELCAGNNLSYGNRDKFLSNNFHPNCGVYLVNIRLFRKDELYKKAIFVLDSYQNFECPQQDLLITIANYKFKFIPLNFNVALYYENEEDKLKKRKNYLIERWLNDQKFSPYKYTFDEIFDAISDPVIYHSYIEKIVDQSKCNKFVIQWLKYAKLIGKYENLKLKYPKPFLCEIF